MSEDSKLWRGYEEKVPSYMTDRSGIWGSSTGKESGS